MQLPAWLTVRSDVGVVVCAEHGSCYVRATLGRHLRDAHQMASRERAVLLGDEDCLAGVVSRVQDVKRPADGIEPLQGLPVYGDAYECRMNVAECCHRSRSEAKMKEHCGTVHRVELSRDERLGRGNLKYRAEYASGLRLQTLFKEKKLVDYFIVTPSEQQQGDGVRLMSNVDFDTSREAGSGSAAAVEERMRRYLQVLQELDEEQAQNVKIGEVQHVSELSNWLKQTGYHAYLDGLDDKEFPSACGLPDRGDEPVLAAICDSIKRLFHKGSDMLDFDNTERRMLSNLNARLLNTFQKSEMSQDPIKSLQNRKSKQNYVETMQELVCFFSRVKEGRHLSKKKMFCSTVRQVLFWREVEAAAKEVVAAQNKGHESDVQGTNEQEEPNHRLDKRTLDFIVALIAHRLPVSVFDSPVVSFVAVKSWSPHRRTWIKIGNYTSLLARITYVCQLFVLLHCIDVSEEDEDTYLSDCIIDFRDKWLLNSTESPVGTMLSMRLLGQKIARMEVQQVTIRWPDEQTVSYGDIRISLQQIRDLLHHELRAAQKVFKEDLCFGFEKAPQYNLTEVIENWQADRPGASFLTNSQNTLLFEEGKTWLYNKINSDPDVSESVYRRSKEDGGWQVKGDVVDMYEQAVQRFLEHMAIVLHLGSGQPARRPEFLGLRWRNRDKAKRNLYVEKGRMMFILSYHKMLHVHNASRFPVRVLMPEAAQLLTQYLALIIPFRSWMLKTHKGDTSLSSYLWADSRGIWPEDRMTRLLKSKAEQVTGVKLTIQAWRQIAVAIAIKFFGGRGRAVETAMHGEDDGDGAGLGEEDGAMPEAFHWQASHTPRSGNRAYASRIDYHGGLTDQGVDEYIHISNMWQDLFAEGAAGRSSSGVKHPRGLSGDIGLHMPLLKRIAVRNVAQRYRRHWSMEEAKAVLRDMYGPNAAYRTPGQERAVQAVTSGLTPVVVVLGTGEGKSLLYMMQQRLPGAGTTVLVVPLVALRQDTIRKCTDMGIDCLVWDHGMGGRIGSELVIVSLDKAVGEEFQADLEVLDSTGRLNSIMIDECHLVLTASDYRKKMMAARELRKFSCQLVFLTATLPRHMMAAFSDRLLLTSPVFIRGQTMRKDIQYEITRCTGTDLCKDTVRFIQRLLQLDMFIDDSKARMIVYCTTKADVEAIADELDCPRYYSNSGSEEEKEKAVQQWMEEGSKVLIATSAFGAGVDYGSVRAVIHVGVPKSAIDFAQEVGRGGRDDGGCVSYVVVPRAWRASSRRKGGELMAVEDLAMQRYIDSPRCRQTILGGFLDGTEQACETWSTACDRCQRLGLIEVGAEIQADGWRAEGSTEHVGCGGEAWGDGAQRLQDVQKAEARDKQVFLSNLEMVRGMCGLCLAEGGLRQARGHVLDGCKRGGKFRFFEMKKQLRKKHGSKWMEPFGGCVGCGLSQEMCSELKVGGCRYKDIAIPVGWGVFWNERWEGLRKKVEDRAGEGEVGWMIWLGRRKMVFGESSNQLVQVMDTVLKELVAEALTGIDKG